MTTERNALAKEVADTNGSKKKIHAIRTAVRRLQDKIADVNRLRDKLTSVEQERNALDWKVRNLMRTLAESRSLSDTMKLNLDATRHVVRDMYSQRETSESQIQLLRKEIECAGAKLDQTQKELASQTKTNERLERESRTLIEKYETVCSERDTANEMYRDLRAGTMRVIAKTREIECEGNNQEPILEDNNQELALNEFVVAK